MTEEEKTLIEAVKKGDSIAQKKLFENLSRKMYGVCLRYAADDFEAQDLLQEGFIKLFNKIEKYTFKGSFEGWVRRLFVNTCLDHIRSKKREINNQSIEDVEYGLGYDDVSFDDMDVQAILDLIQKLSTGYRTVFNMYAIEGYSHKEIANDLGISESTSKSQYLRAKKQLIKMLQENQMV